MFQDLRIFSQALLLVLMSCSTGSSFAQSEAEVFTIQLSNPGAPAELDMHNGSLQISVLGEDRDDMEFSIRGAEESRNRNRRNNGLTRITSNPGFVVEELDNRVSFESSWGNDDYHVIVRVPVETSLNLRTVNGGDMRVEGVRGDHELQNINADITALDIRGSVSAESPNGEIVVRLLEVTPDTPMAFSAINGDVDLTFPPGFSAEARIDPGRGSTYTDFEFTLDDTPSQVETSQDGQGTRMEVKREIRGLLNGGGPLLQIKTFNGDVYIRQGS